MNSSQILARYALSLFDSNDAMLASPEEAETRPPGVKRHPCRRRTGGQSHYPFTMMRVVSPVFIPAEELPAVSPPQEMRQGSCCRRSREEDVRGWQARRTGCHTRPRLSSPLEQEHHAKACDWEPNGCRVALSDPASFVRSRLTARRFESPSRGHWPVQPPKGPERGYGQPLARTAAPRERRVGCRAGSRPRRWCPQRPSLSTGLDPSLHLCGSGAARLLLPRRFQLLQH